MALRLPSRILAACGWTLVLLPCLAAAASTAGKDPVGFDSAVLSGMAVQQLAPVSGFVTPPAAAGMEFPGTAEMLSHPLLAGPYHSGSTLEIADSQAGDGDDDIRPDPRPRMKKFMLIVLLIGAVVKYLTSPSYLKLVSEVTDPWAS